MALTPTTHMAILVACNWLLPNVSNCMHGEYIFACLTEFSHYLFLDSSNAAIAIGASMTAVVVVLSILAVVGVVGGIMLWRHHQKCKENQ